MNFGNKSANKFSSVFSVMLLLVLVGSLISAGCGSTQGETKKKKSKKSRDEAEITSVSEEKDKEKKENGEESKDSEHDEEEDTKQPDKKDDKKPAEKKDSEKKGEEKSDKKTDGEKKEKSVSADQIWSDLARGNKMFMKGSYSVGNLLAKRPGLAKGQEPKVIILGCADSRVPPELVFGKSPGELFVVRDAGNIVDEISLGSMEYAVEHLHSQIIIVLGHESCGAVAATVSGEKMPTKNLQSIVNTIAPALEDSKDCPIGGKMNMSCVELNVKQTVENIKRKSPIIKEAVEKKGLMIIPAIYRMETGEVTRL